ncbi:pyridoxal-phosphate dependent enzyme [Azospirillum sp. BE72]|uniref:pyridoxal-phosphate dependent enzyme n=1 Tax=Azospirillum sp. BE72 TaxID=2817776 RepID=UPI00285A37DE|nr:pyridoxal-phosphate dependent enzyme [Azospirillum sp. BE72]MDR6774847.1 cysteine synthase [Azospirillum sp. BE72]
MRRLRNMRDYGIGGTPLHWARDFCPQGQLALKLEQSNATGSIKARTAYYLLADMIQRGDIEPGCRIVESTSGNLGLALAALAAEIGVGVTCLVDPTVVERKVDRLRACGAEVRVVERGGHPDHRSARMAEAERLGRRSGWLWPNQYANEAGMLAHEETTGPEILQALDGRVDVVVAPVGTGGTLLGIGRALKAHRPGIRLVAVEPEGSTIFGGRPGHYLSAGAGLHEPSPLLRRYGRCIDGFSKVDDETAIRTCLAVAECEPCTIGITAGAAVAVAARIAARNPDLVVVAIVPDAADNYEQIHSLPVPPAGPETPADVTDAADWHLTLASRPASR